MIIPAFAVALVGVLLLVLLAGIALILLLRNGARHGTEAEEARLMQELFEGMSDLGKRVETLETILLDRNRPDRETKA